MKSEETRASRPHRHISQACQNCRAARAKCNGTVPCTRCSERHQYCTYTPGGDGRSSRLDFRYKVAELQHENSILKHFVTYLQQSSEHVNHDILTRLQRVSPTHLCRNVDILVNLIRQASSPPIQPRLGGSDVPSGHRTNFVTESNQEHPCTSSVGQAPGWTLDCDPDQRDASANGPQTFPVSHEHTEAERLAYADTGLLQLLQILQNIPLSNRSLVLEALSKVPSLPVSGDGAIIPPQSDRPATSSSMSQRQFLGSPNARHLSTSSAVMANGYPPEIQAHQLLNFSLPEFAVLPLTLSVPGDKSLLGAFFESFLSAVASALAHGTPVEQIIGPQFVDAEYLLRNREPHENALTIAVWTGSVVRGVMTTDLIAPLANLICMTRLLRWIISPTLQHYADIPEMARPLPLQRLVPHHPELDLACHPIGRMMLIHKYRNDWSIAPDMSDIQIQWPGSPDEILEIDSATGHRRPTKFFEDHVTNIENWRFGEKLLDKYPEIVHYGLKMRE